MVFKNDEFLHVINVVVSLVTSQNLILSSAF